MFQHEKDLGVCEHPLSDITIAGEAAYPLPQTFHSFLQTVSDLMMLLPVGSSLQQIAMRCWCLKFHPEDHSFLHRSHVFSNISKILSRTEDEDDGVPSDNCAQVNTSIVTYLFNSRNEMIHLNRLKDYLYQKPV